MKDAVYVRCSEIFSLNETVHNTRLFYVRRLLKIKKNTFLLVLEIFITTYLS